MRHNRLLCQTVLQTAAAADRTLNPHGWRPSPAYLMTTAVTFTSLVAALEWFEDALDALWERLSAAAMAGDADCAWQLAEVIGRLSRWSDRGFDAREAFVSAVELFDHRDTNSMAVRSCGPALRTELALASLEVGDVLDAHDHAVRAVADADGCQDGVARFHTVTALGKILVRAGEPAEAVSCLHGAHRRALATESPHAEGVVLRYLAEAHVALENWSVAAEYAVQSAAALVTTDRLGAARAQMMLGEVLLSKGSYAHAITVLHTCAADIDAAAKPRTQQKLYALLQRAARCAGHPRADHYTRLVARYDAARQARQEKTPARRHTLVPVRQ